MFRLGHFSKDISFSKINRLQGLLGLRMFRLCHFSKYISFSKINRLQGLRMFRLCHFEIGCKGCEGCGCSDLVIFQKIYHFQR